MTSEIHTVSTGTAAIGLWLMIRAKSINQNGSVIAGEEVICSMICSSRSLKSVRRRLDSLGLAIYGDRCR